MNGILKLVLASAILAGLAVGASEGLRATPSAGGGKAIGDAAAGLACTPAAWPYLAEGCGSQRQMGGIRRIALDLGRETAGGQAAKIPF